MFFQKGAQSGGESEAETVGRGLSVCVCLRRHPGCSGITNSFYMRLIVSVHASVVKGQAQP